MFREVGPGQGGQHGDPDEQRGVVLGGGGSGAVRWTTWTLDMGGSWGMDGLGLVWCGLDGGDAGQAGGPPRYSSTAAAVSSSARSLLIAIAAAEPSPAAVTTWARGLAAFPAAHTPGTLV